MSFQTMKMILNLSEEELDKEIISIRQELFELSLKKAMKQNIKPHLFKHAKRRLAQMLTIKTKIKK